ncbi:MAG: tRNA (cytidine(34)-2'-O)-methyltransferase, partial [Planctomycetes bacterium]|nr:tRNA (cytidine(34)-2'-O)-methyltransferase [Planctomycetota bacterium]
MNIVLVHPEIPQNTGSIGRLCVNLNSTLHLIEPLGFSLEEKMVRRAGLDYWPHLDLRVHTSWDAFLESERPSRLMVATTKSERCAFDYRFESGQYLVFGNESRGFAPEFLERYREVTYALPMPGRFHRSI